MPADLTDYTVTKKAMRPASAKEECFYCHQPVGECHKKDCILVKKKAVVRAKIEYEVNIPACYDYGNILYFHNKLSHCISNIIKELQMLEKNRRSCGKIDYDVVSIQDETFLVE